MHTSPGCSIVPNNIVAQLFRNVLAASLLLIGGFFNISSVIAGPADLGVYKGGGQSGKVVEFENWFGYQIPYVLDFYDTSSWTKLQDNQWLLDSWKNKRWNAVLSIGMLPGDGVSSIAAGASGSYDQYWRNIATRLVNNGYASAHVRIGWEMNASWYPWAAINNQSGWIIYWQRIVNAMRSVTGANFKFTWNPNNGYNQFPAEQVYPGDAYVDYIAIDPYNQTWISNYTDPIARWNDIYAGQRGIRYWLQFANNHGKQIAFPEWGTGTRPDGHGGGDDPYYIAQMYNVITTANIAYHNYWDFPASDFNGLFSNGNFPNSGARFKELFGPVFANGLYAERRYETDVLSVPSKSAAIHQNTTDNNLTYAQGSLLKATVAGDQVSYLLRHIPAGTYNIKVRVRKTASSGKWQLSTGYANNFSGTQQNVGAVQDTYTGSSWIFTELDLGNWTATAAGDRWFRFTCQGKNASSTNYDMTFDYIKLTPVSTSGLARTGTRTLKGVYTTATSWASVYQYSTGFTAGATYTASCWLRGTGKIRMRITDSSWSVIKDQEFTASGTWTLCSYSFVSVGSAVQLVFTGGNNGTLYIDDCFVGTGTTSKLLNGGFESGTTSWNGVTPPETQVVQ